ncbi:uncharacterized protein LOC141615145 [Silene latifolia]|uniref:uncharacterized protein LOC141615145 n=1 Tax=Silene latifolia TaxID=37657 RepID=UPI003D783E29
MESISAKSLIYANSSKPLSCSSTSTCISRFSHRKISQATYQSAQILGFRRVRLHCNGLKYECVRRNVGVVYASSNGGTISAAVAQGWLLEPVGDGDCKHIGYKVERPGAYEIFSSEMIVGRVADKVDLVIPVATVSGLHARLQNKEGSLLVTDLDSTNGTYINETRVAPGSTAIVPPGSLLTFGDDHLAIFRVSRLKKTVEEKEADSEEQTESNGASAAPQPETE